MSNKNKSLKVFIARSDFVEPKSESNFFNQRKFGKDLKLSVKDLLTKVS